MSKSKKRNYYTAEQKVAILRKHLVEGISVSDVCEEFNIKPGLYYSWQKKFFENGAAAFQRSISDERRGLQDEVSELKDKLAKKDEIIAEVAEAFVTLKKELGEP